MAWENICELTVMRKPFLEIILLENKMNNLVQVLENFFVKSQMVMILGFSGLKISNATTPQGLWSSHRQYINTWVWLGTNQKQLVCSLWPSAVVFQLPHSQRINSFLREFFLFRRWDSVALLENITIMSPVTGALRFWLQWLRVKLENALKKCEEKNHDVNMESFVRNRWHQSQTKG